MQVMFDDLCKCFAVFRSLQSDLHVDESLSGELNLGTKPNTKFSYM